MFIQDKKLRTALLNILKHKRRNKIVTDIKGQGHAFHQYHIDNFIAGQDVKLSTLKKIDEYIKRNQ